MKPPILNPPKRDLIIFSLLLLVPAALCLLYFNLPMIAGGIALISILGAIQPKVIKPVHNLLILLTFPIGWTISLLILTLIYFFIITPLSLIKKRPLDFSFPSEGKSNFKPLPKQDPSAYYDPF